MTSMSRLSRLGGFVLVMCLGAGGVAQAANVTLAWDASSDPSVTGYNLYWGNLPGSYLSSLNVGKVTQAAIGGLTDGMPYYFVVRAYNSSGMLSAPSVEEIRQVTEIERAIRDRAVKDAMTQAGLEFIRQGILAAGELRGKVKV